MVLSMAHSLNYYTILYCGKCSQQSFIHGSVVKNPPVNTETQETQVQSLGQENPLEEEMAMHSSVLAWEIPRTEGSGGLQPRGHRVRQDSV